MSSCGQLITHESDSSVSTYFCDKEHVCINIYIYIYVCVCVCVCVCALIHTQLDIRLYIGTQLYRTPRDVMAIFQERVLQVIWNKTA
jgi:hypothetical protein